jgi:hypothetical protein
MNIFYCYKHFLQSKTKNLNEYFITQILHIFNSNDFLQGHHFGTSDINISVVINKYTFGVWLKHN